MSAVYFVGRLHVVALHLPIAFILAAVSFDLFARRARYRQLEYGLHALWGGASISAIVSAGLGYMHSLEGGFEGVAARTHEIAGIALALFATLAWVTRTLRRPVYDRVQPMVAAALVVGLVVTGHSGGTLTHGSTFLVEYAPQVVRSMAGLRSPRPPVTDLAMANPYLDIVDPILQRRCSSCHGNEKRKASLDVTTHASLLKGGESGPSLVPNDPQKSEIVRRITLPEGDEKRMPGEGRPPLSEMEIRAITWWIASGALQDTTVGAMNVGPEDHAMLLAAAGLEGGAAKPAGTNAEAIADLPMLAALDANGFLARQLSRESAMLVVSAPAPGAPMSTQQLKTLLEANEQIAELDLAGSGITDAHLELIGQLSNLAILKLANNQLSDAGMHHLMNLKQLRVLNLYGNASISDATLEILASLPVLERIYVWNTRVTEQGARNLRKKLPTVIVDRGVES